MTLESYVVLLQNSKLAKRTFFFIHVQKMGVIPLGLKNLALREEDWIRTLPAILDQCLSCFVLVIVVVSIYCTRKCLDFSIL